MTFDLQMRDLQMRASSESFGKCLPCCEVGDCPNVPLEPVLIAIESRAAKPAYDNAAPLFEMFHIDQSDTELRLEPTFAARARDVTGNGTSEHSARGRILQLDASIGEAQGVAGKGSFSALPVQ